MASKKMLVLVAAALAVAFLPAPAAATEHSVGDGKGWTLGFDYSAWAETKQFMVGDTLVFKYNEPSHTVVEVSGADFAACNKPATAKVLTTGQDKVTLDKAGRRWFVCGVGAHCQNGMKVKIDVLAAAVGPALAPAPVPGSPSPTTTPSKAGAAPTLAPGAPSTTPASPSAAGVPPSLAPGSPSTTPPPPSSPAVKVQARLAQAAVAVTAVIAAVLVF